MEILRCFETLFFNDVIFLTNKKNIPNVLIVQKLTVFIRKWLNLLTKWYIVVECGNIFYIFALHHLIPIAWIQLLEHMNVKSMLKEGCCYRHL